MGVKIGNLDVIFKVGNNDVDAIYLGDTLLYSGGTPPTPPTFQGKWKATYTGGTVTTAACDASSAITENEITKTDLEAVELGDCVTSIGQGAFRGCSGLTSIDIPDSVTSIGIYAFNNCRSLTSIDIPSGVTSISRSTFNNCRSLTTCTIGSGVISIGDYAFQYCSGLTSCTIGNGVTSIGDEAFADCSSLTSITCLATTPPTLGNSVFGGSTCPIYVPAQSFMDYQSNMYWMLYSQRLQPIS